MLVTEIQEESIVFHDAVEDINDLSDDENTEYNTLPKLSDDAELIQLRNTLASLNRQRARIRNKKVRYPVLSKYSCHPVNTLTFLALLLHSFYWKEMSNHP